jgi:hypothetical protein
VAKPTVENSQQAIIVVFAKQPHPSWLFSTVGSVIECQQGKKLAGAPGFEPGNAGIKTLCLTAWRRPKKLTKPRCQQNSIISVTLRWVVFSP